MSGFFYARKKAQDNPDMESALDVNSGAAAIAALLDPVVEKDEQAEEAKPEEAVEAEEEAVEEADDGDDSEAEEPQKFTIKVDGQEVEVTLEELKNGYQRQSDYTRKTQEAAELRKTADAELQKVQGEREATYSQLQRMQAQLEGVLEQQQQIDWERLLESDPAEYLRQQHLFNQRQAAYQQNLAAQRQVAEQFQADQAKARQDYLSAQRDSLLAKLPDWKDESKATAEKTAIAKYLQEQGFVDDDISAIEDHRHVIVARKAMLYDQMMAKAKVQAKKVQEAPQRVVKPGVGESRPDGRSVAMKRLSKSGSIEDAASVFASFL